MRPVLLTAILLCTLFQVVWSFDFSCYRYCGLNETTLMSPPNFRRDLDIYCDRREVRNPFVLDGRTCHCISGYTGENCIQPISKELPLHVNFNCRHLNETLNGDEALIARVNDVFVRRVSTNTSLTLVEEEQELLTNPLVMDYFEYCGCNIGFGGKFCNVSCESLNNCNDRGHCLYSHYSDQFYCQCHSGIGKICEAPVAASTWISRVINAYLLFITYVALFIIGIIIFISQLRASVMLYKRQTVAKGIYTPPLIVVTSGMLLLALAARVLYHILFFIRDTGTAATISSTFMGIALVDNFFRIFATALLVSCNANMIFRWAQIVNISSKLRNNQNMTIKEKLLLVGINIALYIIFLLAFILNIVIPPASSLVDIENVLSVFLILSMPILFMLYGLQMFFTLRKANQKISVTGFKFMKFLIAIEIISVQIAILSILLVLANALLTSQTLYERSLTDQTAGDQLIVWVRTFSAVYEAVLFFLFEYLLYDVAMVKACIPCMFKAKSAAGANSA